MKQMLFLIVFSVFPAFSLAAQGPIPCYRMVPQACELFHSTNQERVKRGVAPLRFCHRCSAMAQEQSSDMARRGYFDHQRPASGQRPGESFSARADRFGLGNEVGENIAQNGSPKGALQRLLASPPHRRNILQRNFDSMGVGYADGLFTQVFWNSNSRN